MKKEQKNLVVFGYGLSFIFAILAARIHWKHDTFPVVVFFLLLAIFMFTTTLLNQGLLKKIYAGWMKGAHFIGNIFSSIILMIIFYGIFSPLGLFFRIIRKDFLNRQLEREKDTYWRLREQVPFNRERYQKQF